MKYWEIIADNLKKRGWSYGYVSTIDSHGRTIWIADAHRDDGKRFVVHADEKLTAFMEQESAIRAWISELASSTIWLEAGFRNAENPIRVRIFYFCSRCETSNVDVPAWGERRFDEVRPARDGNTKWNSIFLSSLLGGDPTWRHIYDCERDHACCHKQQGNNPTKREQKGNNAGPKQQKKTIS